MHAGVAATAGSRTARPTSLAGASNSPPPCTPSTSSPAEASVASRCLSTSPPSVVTGVFHDCIRRGRHGPSACAAVRDAVYGSRGGGCLYRAGVGRVGSSRSCSAPGCASSAVPGARLLDHRRGPLERDGPPTSAAARSTRSHCRASRAAATRGVAVLAVGAVQRRRHADGALVLGRRRIAAARGGSSALAQLEADGASSTRYASSSRSFTSW